MVQLSKINHEKWIKMTPKEKEPYQKLQDQDVLRYQKEAKEFKTLGFYYNSDGLKSTFMNKKHKVQEFEIGTVLPKFPSTSFFSFINEYYATNKSKFAHGPASQLGKEAGEKWRSLSPKQKDKYALLSQKDK